MNTCIDNNLSFSISAKLISFFNNLFELVLKKLLLCYVFIDNEIVF